MTLADLKAAIAEIERTQPAADMLPVMVKALKPGKRRVDFDAFSVRPAVAFQYDFREVVLLL